MRRGKEREEKEGMHWLRGELASKTLQVYLRINIQNMRKGRNDRQRHKHTYREAGSGDSSKGANSRVVVNGVFAFPTRDCEDTRREDVEASALLTERLQFPFLPFLLRCVAAVAPGVVDGRAAVVARNLRHGFRGKGVECLTGRAEFCDLVVVVVVVPGVVRVGVILLHLLVLLLAGVVAGGRGCVDGCVALVAGHTVHPGREHVQRAALAAELRHLILVVLLLVDRRRGIRRDDLRRRRVRD